MIHTANNRRTTLGKRCFKFGFKIYIYEFKHLVCKFICNLRVCALAHFLRRPLTQVGPQRDALGEAAPPALTHLLQTPGICPAEKGNLAAAFSRRAFLTSSDDLVLERRPRKANCITSFFNRQRSSCIQISGIS